MSELTNERMYRLFCKKNDFNKTFIASMYRPTLISHITKLQDGLVYLSSERKDAATTCLIQQADELVKSIMTTSVCVDNPSKYKGFDFKGLENYFVA